MADFVFQITDGTTTVDFNSGTEYEVKAPRGQTWRPTVATRRRSVMGNQLPWNEVEESIPIRINGASIDAIVASELELVNLIDQSQRWQDGENVAAVTWKYRTHNSTLSAALTTTITGTYAPVLSYTGEYSDSPTTLSRNYILRFRWLGVWVGATETASDNTVNSSEVGDVTFTNNYDYGIVKVDIDTSYSGTNDTSWLGFIFATTRVTTVGSYDQIEIQNAEDYSAASGITAGTPVGSYARSGPTIAETNAASGYLVMELTSIPLYSATLIDVYATARINNASPDTEFELTCYFSEDYDPISNANVINVPGANTADLNIYHLGTYGPSGHNFHIEYARLSGSQTLAIDSIVFINRDLEFTNIVGLTALTSGANYQDYGFDHRILTNRNPWAYYGSGPYGDTPIRASGSLYFLSSGTRMQLMVFVIGGDTATNWRFVSNGASVQSFDIDLTRRPIYLVPQ